MAFKIRYGKGKFSAGFTKPKAKYGNAGNNIHHYNIPNSADKINSTKGYSNRRRLQKENRRYEKQYNNQYNADLQYAKQNNALKYATVNNAITQGVGGATARDIANQDAKIAAQMANKQPGMSQSSNNPGDVSSGNSKPEKTDSTSSMGWIK